MTPTEPDPPSVTAAKRAYRTAWPGQKALMAKKLRDARTDELRRELQERKKQ